MGWHGGGGEDVGWVKRGVEVSCGRGGHRRRVTRAGPPRGRYHGGEGGGGDAEAMRARGGGGRRRGVEAPQHEGVACEGSESLCKLVLRVMVLEAQEALSWLQPCRGRACRHLRIMGGGLHGSRPGGGWGKSTGDMLYYDASCVSRTTDAGFICCRNVAHDLPYGL